MPPRTCNADLSNLPPALKPYMQEKRWVVWRWVERSSNGQAKWTKPPYKPLYPRTSARTNDAGTWGTYLDAIAAVRTGAADGIGLMLLGCDVAAIDIDKCLDTIEGENSSKLKPWAGPIVEEAITAGCYIEATVSGTGVRILALSSGAELHRRWATYGKAGAGIEIYRNTARYITISGCELSQCSKLPETDFLDVLYKRYVDHPPKTTAHTSTPFDFNAAPEQYADIDDIIINGAPEGERSQAFQRVVWHLAERGYNCHEIEVRLKQHPTGIAARYAGRLRREIDRSFEKWRAKNTVIVVDPSSTGSSGTGGTQTSTAAKALRWDSVDRDGIPKPTCANARIAIQLLGIECSYDEFHDTLLLESTKIGVYAGKVSDNAILHLRHLIHEAYRFDPGRDYMRDGVVQLCLCHRFDPIVSYLAALEWDKKPRLETWLIDYLSADDTLLNRAIGKIALVAAVRRARSPGCKFDPIIVLEGVEGTEKSTAIEVLAGRENFSDQSILGMRDQQQQECLCGRWLYEIADLTGMRRAEGEHVKAFASRTHDRARPAYGHFLIDQPRRCVLFATTNDDTYLKSQTANRRFWPVKTATIDIAALRRDRDQLFAEAAHHEAAGMSIVLPRELWGAARAEQDARLEQDPWEDILAEVTGGLYEWEEGKEERISTQHLFSILFPTNIGANATGAQNKRLASCMRRLGWYGPTPMRLGKLMLRGYRRNTLTC